MDKALGMLADIELLPELDLKQIVFTLDLKTLLLTPLTHRLLIEPSRDIFYSLIFLL